MALTTSQLRVAWHPPCKGTRTALAEAYGRLDDILEKYDYRPRSGVTGAYNCRVITGGTGYSLHAYGPGGFFTFWSDVRVSMALAVDINWDKNPYGPRLITDMPQAMVNEIKALRTNNGKQVWRWGGDYGGNKDAMHYEIVCTPADINTGIKDNGIPPKPHPQTKDNKMYAVIQKGIRNDQNQLVPAEPHWWFTDYMTYRYIDDPNEAGRLAYRIRAAGGVVTTAPDGVSPVLWDKADVESMQRTA